MRLIFLALLAAFTLPTVSQAQNGRLIVQSGECIASWYVQQVVRIDLEGKSTDLSAREMLVAFEDFVVDHFDWPDDDYHLRYKLATAMERQVGAAFNKANRQGDHVFRNEAKRLQIQCDRAGLPTGVETVLGKN